MLVNNCKVYLVFIVSIIFKIQIKNKSDILINITKSEDIKDPEHNIDIYIGYLIDAPKKDISDSKYGYSYRSILNTYYKDSKWTYYDNSDNTKIDATAQFDGYDNIEIYYDNSAPDAVNKYNDLVNAFSNYTASVIEAY